MMPRIVKETRKHAEDTGEVMLPPEARSALAEQLLEEHETGPLDAFKMFCEASSLASAWS